MTPSRATVAITRRLRPVLLVAAAVTIAGGALLARQQRPAAQGPEPRPEQPSRSQPASPTFRAGTNLVRVDVFPTLDGQVVRDLTQADFEVLEDGVPQKIESFEHIEVRGQVPTSERREPNSVAEGLAAAADPRSRVFVIFLDTYHTEIAGSHRMRSVLIDLLNRIVGPDDLFAVMTPEMSAKDLTFARRGTLQTLAPAAVMLWTGVGSGSLSRCMFGRLYRFRLLRMTVTCSKLGHGLTLVP